MVIKINYTSSDVYVSTSVSPVYVVVNYSGVSGGGGAVWGGITGTLSDQTDLQTALDAKVPYSGATANVDLGEYELKAGQVEFDQSPTGTAGVGVMRWNDTDGTVDLGLKGGNVTLQIGQEQVQRVVNKSGANLLESAYQVVKVINAQGQRLAVDLAQGNNDLNSADTLGIVTENISNNQEGFITTSGLVRGINTTGSLQGETWVDGDILYLSPTTPGAITKVKPTAPQHSVILGYVVYAHANNGKIFVKVDNGYEIGELHDVYVPSPSNNDGIFWNTANSRYQNNTIAGVLGYTPVPSTRTLTINGTAYDLSADRSWTIATGIGGSLATGQVAFGSAINTIAGSNNLFWDNTNARLGIGTNAPAYKLDVNGSQRVNGSINISNANGILVNNILNATSNGDQQTGLGINVSFLDGAFTGVNHYAVQIAGSGYSQLTANVGQFNLPTNGFGLQVGWNKSNGGGETSLWFNKGGGSTGGLFIGENVSGTGTYFAKFFAATGNLLLQNGGTFTDAGYRLDVNGTARVSGRTTITSNGLFIQGGFDSQSANGLKLHWWADPNAQIVAINSNVVSPLTITASILRLSTNTDLSNIVWGDSNKVIADGNFAVNGNINAGQFVRVGYTALAGGFRAMADGGVTGIVNNDLIIFNNTGQNLFYSSAGTHNFGTLSGTTWTSKAVITAAGRLLLGTTTESTYLADIAGNARVGGTFTISASNGIPAATTDVLNIASGFTTPDIGRIYVGDGTGWKLHFSKRIASVTTDLVSITDTGDFSVSGVLRETITTNRQTASYTLALTDRGKLVEMNVAGANNLTVPLNSSISFPIGSKIDLSQYGAGQTTVVATGGVTIRSAGGALKLAAQYSGASLVKIGTDEWYLFGDITV